MAKVKYWVLAGVDKPVKGTYKMADKVKHMSNYVEEEDGTVHYISGYNKGYDKLEEASADPNCSAVTKNSPKAPVKEKSVTKASQGNSKEASKLQMELEQNTIKEDGSKSWEKYLLDNVNINGIPKDADAICFVDGSFEDDQMSKTKVAEGSFGIIIVPINLRKDDDCIIESSHMKETADKISFEQTFFDEKGIMSKRIESVDLDKDTIKKVEDSKKKEGHEKWSYLGNGWADGIEFEGAYHLLDLCIQKGYKNVYIVCDCDNVLKRIAGNVNDTDSIAIPRFVSKYDEFKKQGGKAHAVEVGSHDNADIWPVEKACVEGEDWIKGNRFCHAMNDMVDLMAKAELKHKNGGKRTAKDNKPLVHLLPDANSEYLPFCKNKSDIMSIYDSIYSAEERRKLTREFCDRLMPLIDKVRK